MEKLHFKKNEPESISPFIQTILMPILRYKKMTYMIVAVTLTITMIYVLTLSNWYTSTATILPSGSGGGLSSLTSLAAGSLAELGLGSVMNADENSSALYPKILSSRLISEKILNRTYTYNEDNKTISKTLYEYIDAENIDKAIEKLKTLVTSDVDMRTGVLRLSVLTEYPELSYNVVQAYLEELNEYNVNHRKSKAEENKQFIQNRLENVKIELKSAENELEELQNNNLNYASSNNPALKKELTALQRNVLVKEAVMIELTKRFELARVEAARDLPIVQVLDKGSVPIVKTKPRRSVILIGALLGSLFFSIMLSLWFDIAKKRKLAYQFTNVLHSDEIEMSSLERKIVDKTAGTINRLTGKIRYTDRESVK